MVQSDLRVESKAESTDDSLSFAILFLGCFSGSDRLHLESIPHDVPPFGLIEPQAIRLLDTNL